MLFVNGIRIETIDAIAHKYCLIYKDQVQDTLVDSVYLVTYRNAKGFKYTPSANELALKISFKISRNPIWTPSDSLIWGLEEHLDELLEKHPKIQFSKGKEEYVRQYIGVTDSAGNRYMLVLFNWVQDAGQAYFGKQTKYNSSIKIVDYNAVGFFVMLAYDIKDKKLVSLQEIGS